MCSDVHPSTATERPDRGNLALSASKHVENTTRVETPRTSLPAAPSASQPRTGRDRDQISTDPAPPRASFRYHPPSAAAYDYLPGVYSPFTDDPDEAAPVKHEPWHVPPTPPAPWYYADGALPVVPLPATTATGAPPWWDRDGVLSIDAYGRSLQLADELVTLAEQHRNRVHGQVRWLRAFPRKWVQAILASDETLADAARHAGIGQPLRSPQRLRAERNARAAARIPTALVEILEVTGDPADEVMFSHIVERLPRDHFPTKQAISVCLKSIGATSKRGGQGSRWCGVSLLD